MTISKLISYMLAFSMFPVQQNQFFLLLQKKITIPYLHNKIKFKIVTALADICSDVDWKSKKIF